MNSHTFENKVYLSLGSNSGDRKSNLLKAIQLLNKEFRLTKLSEIYESESWGYDDNSYLNMCTEISTSLSSYDLLLVTQKIEKEMGRKDKTKIIEGHKPDYKCRNIDIDILLYNNLILQKDELVLPHPKLHLRKFVLLPLCDLDPSIIHPIFKVSIHSLYKRCTDKLSVIPYKK